MCTAGDTREFPQCNEVRGERTRHLILNGNLREGESEEYEASIDDIIRILWSILATSIAVQVEGVCIDPPTSSS